MFFQYINERKSWLLFFVFALLLTNFIIWIDGGIQIEASAIRYLNIIVCSLFMLFFIWRYFVETAYIKALSVLLKEQEVVSEVQLPTPHYSGEQVVDAFIKETIFNYDTKLWEIKDRHIVEADYTAAWVHEVKAPLTAMKMAIDANRQDETIRKIEAEWLRIHLLIDRQLSIARLSSHETDYLLTQTSVQGLLVAEIKELASWCLEKQIAIEFEGEDVEVVTDEKWCRFILRQILTNSVKYSPVGSMIVIHIGEESTGNVRITIADEGPGVEQHELPRLFEKGFTGDTGRIHNAATGLGLYLAKMVASRIGVRLFADAEVEKGMTMSVVFPTENEFDQTIHTSSP